MIKLSQSSGGMKFWSDVWKKGIGSPLDRSRGISVRPRIADLSVVSVSFYKHVRVRQDLLERLCIMA